VQCISLIWHISIDSANGWCCLYKLSRPGTDFEVGGNSILVKKVNKKLIMCLILLLFVKATFLLLVNTESSVILPIKWGVFWYTRRHSPTICYWVLLPFTTGNNAVGNGAIASCGNCRVYYIKGRKLERGRIIWLG
jgi:hypothetical protein